ncbi:MAG TPA: tetratricopeptide repeat protein, partial [Polyangia bacterium]
MAVAVALVALPARAEGKRDKGGQKLVDQGRRAYNLGHWSDALADFEKAYEESGDSALLFNLAETHRQLGHTADAVRLYNAYLRELPNGHDHEAAATELKNLTGTATATKAPPP